jgi:hypothetical protein
MLFDSRMGEKADHKDPVLAPTWDCKIPLNCNDSDLWPDMKELPPASRSRTTEALFTVLRSEVADHMRNTSWFLDFSNPCLKAIAKELPEGGNIDALWSRLERDYLRLCDAENRLHFVTYHMAKSHIFRSRLFEHFAQFLNTNGQQSEEERDRGMEIALDYLDCDTTLTSSPLCQGYRWYLQSHFPFAAYMHIIQDLRRRPLCRVAQRAWESMSANYRSRFEAYFHYLNNAHKITTPLFIMFSRTVLTAWEALQKATTDPASLQTPKIVDDILKRHMAAMPIATAETSPFTDAQSITNSIASFTSSAPTPSSSISYNLESGPNRFVMNIDAMPYPSMVAPDSFTYDANQLDWFLQP